VHQSAVIEAADGAEGDYRVLLNESLQVLHGRTPAIEYRK
jgi:hypothetical protein